MKDMFLNINDDEGGIDIDNFDIQEELKLFEDYIPSPTTILVRLYIPSNIRKNSGLIVSNSKAKFEETTGYVAKIGKCCFSGEAFKDWGEWYKVGDWVMFPRASGMRVKYKGLPVFAMYDTVPMAKVDDPRHVEVK